MIQTDEICIYICIYTYLNSLGGNIVTLNVCYCIFKSTQAFI